MQFTSIRIITANIEALIAFYEKITGTTAIRYTEDFAEIKSPLATLALASTRTLQLFSAENMAAPGKNQSVIIEFKVDDVDKCYEALVDVISNALVQQPTTMPWGNRSLLFRDPDGNLVNLFTPVSAAAKGRAN